MHNSFHAISMLSGIHALDGDMPEAEHYAEIIRAGDWEAGYLDGYRGTFYRIAEALLAIERGDVRAAAAQVRVFLPHRATSEHWAAMASAEAWVSLHAGEADAGLERLESLARLRGREATSPAARHTLSRPRALLHTALGDVAAAKQVLQRDGNADRFTTAVERARVALVDGRPADAVRILDRHRGGPENARQRADAAAIRAAAVARSAGDPAARASIASLRLVLDDRELRTPAVLLDQDDADAVTGLLRDAGLTVPSAVRSPFPRRSAVPRLSARERVVLDALTTGQSLRAIAEELHVSQNTLKTQLRGLYRKLGAANRADAIEKAAAAGLLTRR
jgi:LuxR family maltose regulon positive regulatory protein